MTLRDEIRTGPFYLDGGMGTLLQARGLTPGTAPEEWDLTHPEKVTEVHENYFRAGSRMVMANTFGVHPLRYSPEVCEKMIAAALGCAGDARMRCGAAGRYIALDMGPCGRLLSPLGDLDFEEAVRHFSLIAKLGEKHGADCVVIETMTDGYETRAALLAVKESCGLPVMVMNAYGEDGRMLTGGTPEAMTAMLEGLGADAVGVNCSLGPDALTPIVERYLKCTGVPVVMKPNAGLPLILNGKTVYPLEPGDFARSVAALVPKGLRILGGCCGTTPEHIRALREAVGDTRPPALTARTGTVIASRSRTVTLGVSPVMIGERINPTGKKRLRQALTEGDIDYVLGEAFRQEEAGAQVLDVNVGAPGVDEAAVLPRVVTELQAVTDLPLQLDTASPEAMEKALRRYNGKPLINSVNGREDIMDAVFPLAKKYGGVLAALALDEDGIPATAEGRLKVAQKILRKAEEYAFPKEDLLFDPLTLPVSADPAAARTTLQALKLIREKTGCPVMLGVSNVSFGLPSRGTIGSAFLTLALEEGLDAAIMDPTDQKMRAAFLSFRALKGMDGNCADYIAFASVLTAAPAPAAVANAPAADTAQDRATLGHAVKKGLRAEAARRAAEALEAGTDGMALIRDEIIPALNEVGKGFEAKTLYLPQLLMSAEAAEAAFGIIRERTKTGGAQNGPRMVLATVRGDVHDIGKNIVRLLMENYGYRVTDLGKDVPPEKILDAVTRLDAPLLGLSALMTTTVPAMEETIRLVHEKAPRCRIIVGGAVLTESWAQSIGADGYARDAMAAVRLAEKWMNQQN